MGGHAAWTVIALLVLGSAAVAQEPVVARRKLGREESIGGILCGPTGRAKAGVYPSGKLESCPLAVDAVVQGHALKAGSWIYLTETGFLTRAWLSEDSDIDGHRCKGTGYKGWSVDFHPNGRVKVCFLASEEVIQGVPCRKGSFWGEARGGVIVRFYENGNLDSCAAARDFTLGERRFRGRERVHLAPDGTVPTPSS